MSDKFSKIYDQSIKDPEKFWQEASNDIFWFKKPTKILNKSNPPFYKWYEDGVTNTCYNALDFHIDQGKGNKTALIYDSPITENKNKFTYEELRSKVSKFAGALKDQGVNKGDRVIIYMPMIPEAVVAMLACARIGAPHSVVFGGFSSEALKDRLIDGNARFVITADGGIKKDKVFELLSDHPFLISNPENARKMAEFRIFSLNKFKFHHGYYICIINFCISHNPYRFWISSCSYRWSWKFAIHRFKICS